MPQAASNAHNEATVAQRAAVDTLVIVK